MKALLIQPKSFQMSYWTLKEAAELMGAKYQEPPLGLLTLASLMPANWAIRLVDLHVNDLDDATIGWADMVFIGGMITQRENFLGLIDRIHAHGKKVVAGGADPTSRPDLYKDADYLVLGEAELSLEPFLRDLEQGTLKKEYIPEENADITKTPAPKYNLVNFDDYLLMNVQFSRGCPFNCEFCESIEIFRKYKTKTEEQVIDELNALYNTGYRGLVNIVDDNFIGNIPHIKRVLRTIREWSIRKKYPFFYHVQASVNIADDEELLELMRDAEIRIVYLGIETDESDVLKAVNKKQNLKRSVKDDIHKIYQYGIEVMGGCILGFDNESDHAAQAIADMIDKACITKCMIGFLYALPRTRLARRLKTENRLFENEDFYIDVADQTKTGLNFITVRPRVDILEDCRKILNNIYNTRSYFDRCLNVSRALNVNFSNRYKHKHPLKKKVKFLKAFFIIIYKLGFSRETAYYFWRNYYTILFTKPFALEALVNNMALYNHFKTQSAFITTEINRQLKTVKEMGEENYNTLMLNEKCCN